jgi:hypothetical protein
MDQPKRRVEEAKTLRDAAQTVVSIRSKLNTSSTVCAGCGRRHDVNYTDAEIGRRLSRISTDIAKVAAVLAEGTDLLAERAVAKGRKK